MTKISRLFKTNIAILIILYFLSSSIFATDIIRFGKVIMPIVIVILWITNIYINKLSIKKTDAVILFLFGLYFIFAVLSTFTSIDKIITFSEISGLIIMFLISFCIIPYYIDTENKYMEFIILINKILTLLLLLSVAIGYNNPGLTYTNYGNRLRYKSILTNSNALGSYAMLGGISSLSLIYLKGEKRYFIPLIFNLSLLYLSDSRTSLYTLIIFTIIIVGFYFSSKGKSFKLLMKILKAFSIIAVSILLLVLLFNIENISFVKINSILSGRAELWLSPFEGFTASQVLFGKGSNRSFINPHNYYIKSIMSWGLVSTVIFIIIMAYLLIDIIKKIKKTDNNVRLYITLSIYISFLAFSFFESMFFNIGNLASMVLWIHLGLSLNLTKE